LSNAKMVNIISTSSLDQIKPKNEVIWLIFSSDLLFCLWTSSDLLSSNFLKWHHKQRRKLPWEKFRQSANNSKNYVYTNVLAPGSFKHHSLVAKEHTTLFGTRKEDDKNDELTINSIMWSWWLSTAGNPKLKPVFCNIFLHAMK